MHMLTVPIASHHVLKMQLLVESLHLAKLEVYLPMYTPLGVKESKIRLLGTAPALSHMDKQTMEHACIHHHVLSIKAAEGQDVQGSCLPNLHELLQILEPAKVHLPMLLYTGNSLHTSHIKEQVHVVCSSSCDVHARCMLSGIGRLHVKSSPNLIHLQCSALMGPGILCSC